EKAIIDAGQAFAAGQVYVALSRCTSLNGIVLHSRIGAHTINTDYRVVEFAQREASQEYLEPTLAREKKAFELVQIKKMFDWKNIEEGLRKWQGELPARKIDKQADAILLTCELLKKALQQREVAAKFQKLLEGITPTIEEPDTVEKLKERMNKSIGHFTKAVHEELIAPLKEHIEETKKAKQSKVRSYLEELDALHTLLWDKIDDLWGATYNGATFNEGLQEYKRHGADPAEKPPAVVEPAKPVSKIKQPVGTTRIESLRQYQEGKTIDEIAQQRNLARGTIEGHLAESIGLGEIELTAVLDTERIAIIMPVVQKHGHASLSPIREELGEDFTFTEIRMVAQHVKRIAALATSDS
ncbi:MAG TPA: helix-turn-helix domain-containing protein, partial [Chitinophagaceae bacterium]|nr:helix-turn-helix domain-containing protein [Chitinophagaceae bacterium]